MKQHSKKAVKEAERLGYEFVRVNASDALIYEHPIAGEIALSQTMNEQASRSVIRTMQKAVGKMVRVNGRNAGAIKERDRRRAELDAERLAAERRSIEAQHAAYLARIGAATLTQLDRTELARLEARLAEIRQLQALMTDVPASREHQGRGTVRHTAGAR